MLTKTMIVGSTGLLLALGTVPGMASGGDRPEISSEGACSAGARWELKVKERDGGVEVEFEVDSNVVGQQWDYVLSGPDGQLSSGTRTTTAPSGSFSVEVETAGSVAEAFRGVATNAGQTCDSNVGVGSGDDSGDDSSDDSADDTRVTIPGTCSAGSEMKLKVKRGARFRIAELEVDSDRRGQKWRYTIERGSKTVTKGVARTKGRSGSFTVKAKAKGKGRINAVAQRVSGAEDCSLDR